MDEMKMISDSNRQVGTMRRPKPQRTTLLGQIAFTLASPHSLGASIHGNSLLGAWALDCRHIQQKQWRDSKIFTAPKKSVSNHLGQSSTSITDKIWPFLDSLAENSNYVPDEISL
jgi:hypothetical protein